MTKTCIIGVSGYGAVHYDQLLMPAHAAGRVEILGAAVINQDEEAAKCARLRELGCRIFDDYQEMLRELSGTADLCMIPTGTPLHCAMTVAALNAGMHVLVEKPAAGSIVDVRKMLAASRKTGLGVAVGYQQMYAPATMATKRRILDGAIGKVNSIRCLAMWPRGHEYYNRNGWAGTLSYHGTDVNDSPFNNAVAHDLMMMLFQAGAVEEAAATPVSVEAELYRANAIESFDTGYLYIETAEGIPIRFYATHACTEVFDPQIQISGSKGSIVITHSGSTIVPDGGETIALEHEGDDGARRAMMRSVLSKLEGESSFVCDLELASRQTMVVSAAHQSGTIHAVEGRTAARAGSSINFIPGIEEVMRTAFESESSLSETGAAWAHPATRGECL